MSRLIASFLLGQMKSLCWNGRDSYPLI